MTLLPQERLAPGSRGAERPRAPAAQVATFPGHRTAQQRIVAELRRAILSQELPPGAPVTQNELARRMHTSISPVREAVRQLAAEGLLRIDTHTRVFVAPLAGTELEEVYELLMVLEPLAMRKAAGKLTEAQAGVAETLIDQMSAEHDSGTWPILNADFHHTLAAASGAHQLTRLLASLRNIGAIYVGVSLRSASLRYADSDLEHRRILRAVLAGDGKAAADLTHKHLRATLELCKEGIPLG